MTNMRSCLICDDNEHARMIDMYGGSQLGGALECGEDVMVYNNDPHVLMT